MAENEFDYKRYLASREWALLREAVRLRAGLGIPAWAADAYCERCRLHRLAATHHLTYERIGHEDLNGVCRGCHAYLSGKSEDDPVDEALANEEEELVSWTAMLRMVSPTEDGSDAQLRGCLGVVRSVKDEIGRLRFRRAAIAAGKPASEILQ